MPIVDIIVIVLHAPLIVFGVTAAMAVLIQKLKKISNLID